MRMKDWAVKLDDFLKLGGNDLLTHAGKISAKLVPIDAAIATKAANLAVEHKLPLADSLIYAVTLSHNATLWTQDSDFEGLPHVRYFPKQIK